MPQRKAFIGCGVGHRFLDVDGFLNCSASESEAVCLERAIVSFATRAFRRPLTQAETALVLTYLGTGFSRDETTKMSLPYLEPSVSLYRPEAGLPLAADPTLAHLDDYAIASRLSYFFLNRPPDDTLRARLRRANYTPAHKSKSMPNGWRKTQKRWTCSRTFIPIG